MFIYPINLMRNPGAGMALQTDRAGLLLPLGREERPRGYLEGGGKRLFDLLLAPLLLLLVAPLLLAAMLALWLSTLGREPVLYRQARVGLDGRRFSLLKLRTMAVDAEAGGIAMTLPGDPRVTRLGRLLRRYRIDEIPQLLNVLRGEMSLIGPRPERPEFVGRFSREIEGYGLRHRVRPGITGLAQISYGYGEGLEGAAVKLFYDLSYIQGMGLLRDLGILLRTLPVVLKGRGAR